MGVDKIEEAASGRLLQSRRTCRTLSGLKSLTLIPSPPYFGQRFQSRRAPLVSLTCGTGYGRLSIPRGYIDQAQRVNYSASSPNLCTYSATTERPVSP